MSFLLSQYLHLASFANNNNNPVLIKLCVFITLFYSNFRQKTSSVFVIGFEFDTIFLKNSKKEKENDNKSVTSFHTNIDICVLDDVLTHDEGFLDCYFTMFNIVLLRYDLYNNFY